MKKLLRYLFAKGPHSVFHIFTLACLIQGVLIIATATDLGPLTPILVSVGIYLAMFAFVLEFLYWAKVVLALIAARWE